MGFFKISIKYINLPKASKQVLENFRGSNEECLDQIYKYLSNLSFSKNILFKCWIYYVSIIFMQISKIAQPKPIYQNERSLIHLQLSKASLQTT